MLRLPIAFLIAFLAGTLVVGQENEPALRRDARSALHKAANYYRTTVASRGGYVYYYSLDLEQRWGEGKATQDTIFVQPPGTPTVGMAYLAAHRATGDSFYLTAARAAAEALIYGQLESGGWTQTVEFKPNERAARHRNGQGGKRNTSSLDDGETQSALQLLMQVDEALGFRNERIHEAATYGLNALLSAQFPSGAFPQVWTGPVERHPVRRARYPEYDWKTAGRIRNYWDQYTLNDGLAGTVAETLIEAHRVYGEERYKAALAKLGDFLIVAQMPDPQPAWCQQYNAQMFPIWARKFEPPAISSWESQDAMQTLIRIAEYTVDNKYLTPLPPALEYLAKCHLPDGKLPRFLELQTNKPLYMNARYELTYDDSDVPEHYGWKQSSRLDRIQRDYRAAVGSETAVAAQQATPRENNIHEIIAALDDQGRWVSTYSGERLTGQPKFKTGQQYLSSAVFASNVKALSEYLTSTAPK